jgi:hypothetical protein
MARFYGTVTNGRGTETKVGGTSGVSGAHISGWDVGIRVHTVKLADGDRLDVYMTGGSNGSTGEVFIGSAILQKGDVAPRFEPRDALLLRLIQLRLVDMEAAARHPDNLQGVAADLLDADPEAPMKAIVGTPLHRPHTGPCTLTIHAALNMNQ